MMNNLVDRGGNGQCHVILIDGATSLSTLHPMATDLHKSTLSKQERDWKSMKAGHGSTCITEGLLICGLSFPAESNVGCARSADEGGGQTGRRVLQG